MPSGFTTAPPTVLAARLRDLREVAGFTQQQMAEELGLQHQRMVCHWEIGINEPTLGTLRRYARVFELTLAQLLDGIE